MKEPVMAKVIDRFEEIDMPPATITNVDPGVWDKFKKERWVIVCKHSGDDTDVFFVNPEVMKRWSYFGAFLKRGKR